PDASEYLSMTNTVMGDSGLRVTADRLFVIGGPCVIESADLCLTVARHVKRVTELLGMTYVFKASFDKANRSSNDSFRGPGLAGGLAILEQVKREVGVAVLTDIHEPNQAAEAGKVVDVLQVPAFLARQTDLLIACGKTGRWVNIKKGQFMSPQEMGNAVAKVKSTGNEKIMLTERGTFFGYNRLVNDLTALPIMKGFNVPVVFDVTHSTQQPAGLGNQSGGNPEHSPMLARAAVAAGVDGLFLECHPEPKKAKSDAATMMKLDDVERVLTHCKQIFDLRKSW
ncbi:MAG TPA: 3-deoxy-8-phosphooctulonate synthase, partial [Tepidisphaeraceae bacterium]